jgi:hypothetical protein
MLDKLLKMDSVLLTIKAQIAKYKALFAAEGTIDAAEQAFLDALETGQQTGTGGRLRPCELATW